MTDETSASRPRPHFLMTFDDIILLVERVGDPVEISIGTTVRMLPLKLAQQIGYALVNASKSSTEAARSRRERERHDVEHSAFSEPRP